MTDLFLSMLATAVHWFNPVVWLMQREAAVDMELACDERVVFAVSGTEIKMEWNPEM